MADLNEKKGASDGDAASHTIYDTNEAIRSGSENASEKVASNTDAYAHIRDGKLGEQLVNNNVDARIANPLAGIPREQIKLDAKEFAQRYGLDEYTDIMVKGALVAQDPFAFDAVPELDEADREVLRREVTHKWSHPFQLYALVVLCAVAAAVQGMDESVINGALLFFPAQFGIGDDNADRDNWLRGLIGAAPYVACAFLGCWLTDPLNHFLGRRGTIFFGAIICCLTCIWSAVTNSWQHLFVARLVLGLGIGPNSATVPVYAAECAPPLIRGALVMQWQTWTAFGIMLGYVSDLAFYHVKDTTPSITGLNWRIMLASACFPAIILAAQVFTSPESPRWLMKKGRYTQAMKSFLRLRNTPLQACRDLYLAHVTIEAENSVRHTQSKFRFLELWTVPRNRRASYASTILMFGQQFCGVNVIAYYSSNILSGAGFSDINALLGSFGFGILNFVFAGPAIWTIDTFGRRNLVLATTPPMCLALLMTGFSFFAEEQQVRTGIVLTGIYLYAVFYSPGMGPVPFSYSAEAFPLRVRELGMSQATAVLWFFNAVLAVTFFKLRQAFTPQGAFGWYAVFAVPTQKHAAYQIRQIPYFAKKYIFRQKVEKEQLYNFDNTTNAPRTANPL
ncbi:Predicted transporter (major facilitator superfamily) [Ceraceosorus bombacis]|uniref:Predicted transporter (Major facilitator superfamily) n=1 Tax=Ceraceosorus bombacis TaxID=401625 RepID=A0A0P1BEV2_9BASI|nr:Predicted transporter (major facilitator superfamily) [Ceraceosorus bombacis]